MAHRFLKYPQGRRRVHAGTEQKVIRCREDVVDKRVGGQVFCQVFTIPEQRSGATRSFEGEPACFLGIAGCFAVQLWLAGPDLLGIEVGNRLGARGLEQSAAAATAARPGSLRAVCQRTWPGPAMP